MICLDTNYLIRGLIPGTEEAGEIKSWLKGGIPLTAPAIVWYEFCCGPVQDREIETVRSVLTEGVLPFGEAEAENAARLFNAVGRVRRLRVDTMVAAAALCAGAELATSNRSDFEAFCRYGLRLYGNE